MRSIAHGVAAASLALTRTFHAAITGVGSTFVFPVLSRWANDFKKAGGDEINYQSIGSGGGIAQIKGRYRRLRRNGQATLERRLGRGIKT